MKIAIPVWEGRVSPVLDTAERLLVVDIGEEGIVKRSEIDISGKGLLEKACDIKSNADTLICGALSKSLESYLLSRNVVIYPWVMGEVERLLDIYSCGNEPGPEYYMPGCRMTRQRGRGCRGRRGRRGSQNGMLDK